MEATEGVEGFEIKVMSKGKKVGTLIMREVEERRSVKVKRSN